MNAAAGDLQSRLNGPIHAERQLRVVCVGAGASGLLLAYRLQRDFENYTLTIYEKNEEPSGTWTENRYPGCACDVPSHNYTYSFEPNPSYSSIYSGSREINSYFNNFARKYNLNRFVKCKHTVTAVKWYEEALKWKIWVKDENSGQTIEDTCDMVVYAGGFLNKWKWPDVEGLDTFKGKLLHSARWDEDVDLKGKKVGLIGNGSSAIQILPAIQPDVGHLVNFIRSPTWIIPPFGMEQRHFTDSEMAEFKNKQNKLLKYRMECEAGINQIFNMFIKDSDMQKETRQATVESMKQKLNNEELAKKVIPEWSVGCRRPTPGPGYLEALSASNVEVIFDGVASVTPTGCVTSSGSHHEMDVLICATGFDVSFRPRFPVIGFNNLNLQDAWSKEPESYLALAAADFPNYFMLLGPNSPVGNGPVISGMEAQVEYILRILDRWQTENIKTFAPKQEAVRDFTEFCDKFFPKTIWHDDCRSWYKNHSIHGRVTGLWCGSTLHYIEAMREPRWDDWDVRYKGNRFEWLGNGFSQTEKDPESDLAYYVVEQDVCQPLTRRGRRKMLTAKRELVVEGEEDEKVEEVASADGQVGIVAKSNL